MDEIKRERGDAFRRTLTRSKVMTPPQRHQDDEDDTCSVNSSRISIAPSESTQNCIKFERNVYKTLMNLNNEMSSTLCGGVKDINDVCFKIMQCLHDMEKQDRLYKQMRHSNSDVLPSLPALMERKVVASSTTMTSKTSLCDTKTLQVEADLLEIKKSVDNNATSVDQTVQCSFLCDVPNELVETQSMQQAFKECLEAFIKDVEQVSIQYMEEVKKGQAKSEEIKDVPSIENLKIVNDGKLDKIHGYVCKCKAVHNLHEKLVKQVEACDSYCEFQRKMAQNLQVINGRKSSGGTPFCCYHKKLLKSAGSKTEPPQKEEKPPVVVEAKSKIKPQPQQQPPEKKKNLASKYNDSLWFTWTPKNNKEKKKHHKHKPRPTKKPKFMVESTSITASLPPQPVQTILKKKPEDTPKELPPPPASDNTSTLQINSGHLIRASNTLNCVDILEELTEKDVEPILSEYPRRDEIPEAQRQIEDSFLYQMVYGRNNRNVLEILSSVESPRIHCSAPACERCISKSATTGTTIANLGRKSGKSGYKGLVKKKQQNRSASSDQSSSKDSTPRKASDKVVSKLQKYIHDPHLRYRTTITVMPVRVFHQHPPQRELHTSGDFEDNAKPKTPNSNRRPATPTIPSTSKEKKLWANKYPKSVCQNLVSFIEKQEPLPQMAMDVKKRPSTKKVISKPKSAPLAKKCDSDRKMLNNMGLLASIDKNGLEMNIQKIIEMIELKIIDIISDPEKQNPDAFNEIEREITDVLQQMRSIGGGEPQQQVRKLRQDNFRLTALETILDLEVIGNSVVNQSITDMGKSQTATDLLADKRTNDDSEEEKCMVTAAVAPEKTTEETQSIIDVAEEKIAKVNSQDFLTPFMQDLKKHRRGGAVETKDKKASYHSIIEFLDNLTNMSDDCTIVLYYKQTIGMTQVLHEAHEHFLTETHCPVKFYNFYRDGAAQTTPPSEIAIQTNKTESRTIVVQSYMLADDATCMEHEYINAGTQLNNFEEVDEVIFLAEEKLKEGQKIWMKWMETSESCEPDRAKLLNKFYGLLFTLMYFALTFDYECA